MKEKLFDILSDVLEIERALINEQLSQENCEEWDSVTHLTLVAELEDVFEVSFEPDEIEQMSDVASILKTLNI